MQTKTRSNCHEFGYGISLKSLRESWQDVDAYVAASALSGSGGVWIWKNLGLSFISGRATTVCSNFPNFSERRINPDFTFKNCCMIAKPIMFSKKSRIWYWLWRTVLNYLLSPYLNSLILSYGILTLKFYQVLFRYFRNIFSFHYLVFCRIYNDLKIPQNVFTTKLDRSSALNDFQACVQRFAKYISHFYIVKLFFFRGCAWFLYFVEFWCFLIKFYFEFYSF